MYLCKTSCLAYVHLKNFHGFLLIRKLGKTQRGPKTVMPAV